MNIDFYRCGDHALTMEFGRCISEDINDLVLAAEHSLCDEPVTGVIETVPTYRSLLVDYDSSVISFSDLSACLRRRMDNIDPSSTAKYRRWDIPCCYGLYFAQDMDAVMEHTGLKCEEIIQRHSAADYRVYMQGFLPGFVYLGGLDPLLETPRLKKPRLKIPRGAVGIGGSQTGVYPVASPGGWNLIGCTPVELYEPRRGEPILCSAGDHIRFVPINSCEYYDIRHEILRESFRLEPTVVKGRCI